MKKFNYLALSSIAVLFAFSACDNIPSPDYWAQPRVTTVLFNEDFGTTATQTGTLWPTIAEYTGFQTTGIGADSVRYSTVGTVTVRTTGASNFPGASGGANVFFSQSGADFLIHNIATCGARNLLLSFGSNQTRDVLDVAYRISGSNEWIFIDYRKDTEAWGLVSGLSITLPEGTNTIHLKFSASPSSGTRIDDIRIITHDEVGEPIIDSDEVTPPVETSLLLFEDFGTTAAQVGGSWPTITEYDGFRREGAGASEIYFSSEGGRVDVRSNAVSSFPNASGGSNVMLAGAGANFFINNIATCGARNLILSFGANQTNNIISVAYQVNGSNEWNVIDFQKDTTTWALVENLEFTLPEGTNTFRLRFTAGATQFGTRLDDIRIVTEDEIGEPVFD